MRERGGREGPPSSLNPAAFGDRESVRRLPYKRPPGRCRRSKRPPCRGRAPAPFATCVRGRRFAGASRWLAAATFVEESGEVLAAVWFLTSVLAGVTPRQVLSAEWAPRRKADAHTLDLPEQCPVVPAASGAADS
ncbi:MAG: hypothetical protein ACXVXP_14670 [Mycobacteriaceae bacterium]